MLAHREADEQERTSAVNLLIITCCSKILKECNRQRSETDRHHYVNDEGLAADGCCTYSPSSVRNPRAICHRVHITHIRSLGTDGAITAALNTGNHDRYRAPDLIRFDTDSACVFLRPGSDSGERTNWIGWESALNCVVIDGGRVWTGGKCEHFYRSKPLHSNVYSLYPDYIHAIAC